MRSSRRSKNKRTRQGAVSTTNHRLKKKNAGTLERARKNPKETVLRSKKSERN